VKKKLPFVMARCAATIAPCPSRDTCARYAPEGRGQDMLPLIDGSEFLQGTTLQKCDMFTLNEVKKT